jgi:hypothetical protein
MGKYIFAIVAIAKIALRYSFLHLFLSLDNAICDTIATWAKITIIFLGT